jgi:hypothetical protein
MNTILQESAHPSDRMFCCSIRASFIARDCFRNVPDSFQYGITDVIRISTAQNFYEWLHPFQYSSSIHTSICEILGSQCTPLYEAFFQSLHVSHTDFEIQLLGSHSCSKDHLRHVRSLFTARTGPRFKCFLFRFPTLEYFFEIHFYGTTVECVLRYSSPLARSMEPFAIPFQPFYTHKYKHLRYDSMLLSDARFHVQNES